MPTSTILPNVEGLNRDDLDRRIVAMYRDVATDAHVDLHFPIGRRLAEALGYPYDLLDRLPAQAVRSFAGVGYHLDLAYLRPGERVLDLGSGAGMDVFAAANQVGPAGAVAGVDMTPEQVAKANRARREHHTRFHEGRIEELPFSDASFDVVISNGVINLSADKPRVFAEAARVLRPGGRLAVSDIVTAREIDDPITARSELWAACIAGATPARRYFDEIADAGFHVHHVRRNSYRFTSERARRATDRFGARSISLLAVKPTTTKTQEVSR